MSLLNPSKVADLLRSGTPCKVPDGESLFLVVRAPGKAYWVGQYRNGTTFNSTGLGSAAKVSPAAARRAWEAFRVARRTARTGALFDAVGGALRDQPHGAVEGALPAPPHAPSALQGEPHNRTFGTAVADYLRNHSGEWGDKARSQYAHLARTYLAPIATVRCRRLTVDQIADVLRPVWTGPGSNRGGRLRGLIENVLHAEGVSPNPAVWAGLKFKLSRKAVAARKQPSLPWQQVPALVARLDDSRYGRALRLIILTACRREEAVGADWSEFDLAARVWTIPASRTKMGRDHRVPLSDAAIAALGKPGSGLVFGTMGHDRLRTLLGTFGLTDKHGEPVTVHGFRATFATWAQERKVRGEVIEAALAHQKGGVEGSYQRSDYLDERRDVMAQWAAFATA
jgi:integrase